METKKEGEEQGEKLCKVREGGGWKARGVRQPVATGMGWMMISVENSPELTQESFQIPKRTHTRHSTKIELGQSTGKK